MYVFMERILENLVNILHTSFQISFIFLTTWAIRIEIGLLFGLKDDDPIYKVVASKFGGYADFDTLLHTCNDEFDFLPRKTFTSLSKTLLLPAAVFVCSLFFGRVVKGVNNCYKDSHSKLKLPVLGV